MLFSVPLAFKLVFKICPGFLYSVPTDVDLAQPIRISNLLVRKHTRSGRPDKADGDGRQMIPGEEEGRKRSVFPADSLEDAFERLLDFWLVILGNLPCCVLLTSNSCSVK